MSDPASTIVSRIVDVPPAKVYGAYLDPDAVAAWLAPTSMTGVVHAFDPREGGAFAISLVYLDDDGSSGGKTRDDTDTFRGRFARLVPEKTVEWAVEFESGDASYSGEMVVCTTLERVPSGTRVTIRCDNIPPGIRLEDNETGCRETLDKLAAYLGA